MTRAGEEIATPMSADDGETEAAPTVGQPLSADERRVLDFIIWYLVSHTYQPSVRDICDGCGHKSTKTVSTLIQCLADKGYLEPDPSRARAVRIVGIEITISRSLVPPAIRQQRRARRSPQAGEAPSHAEAAGH